MNSSRSWVMMGPNQLEIKELTVPDIADDCILLKVEACGICGTDKHVCTNVSSKAPFPFVAGHEIIGRIDKIGKRASDSMNFIGGSLKEGDRVALAPSGKVCGRCFYCRYMPHRPTFCPNRNVVYGFTTLNKEPGLWGGYGEYIYVLPGSNLFKIPENMSLKKAILIEPMATAMRAVERAYSPGEPFMGHGYGMGRNAMVLGAGPIGLMAVAALRYSGADTIIVQDLWQKRLDMSKKLGADLTINGNRPIEERLTEVQKVTEGVGPDVVIEAAGAPKAFSEGITFARRGGKLVEAGNFTDNGPTEVTPYVVCYKDLDIHGSFGYPARIFADVIAMLVRTVLPVEDIVTTILPFEDLPRGFEILGSENVAKVVVTP